MDDTLKEIAILLKNRKLKHIRNRNSSRVFSYLLFTVLEENGRIDTIEREEERVRKAKENIKRAEVGREKSRYILVMLLKSLPTFAKENTI